MVQGSPFADVEVVPPDVPPAGAPPPAAPRGKPDDRVTESREPAGVPVAAADPGEPLPLFDPAEHLALHVRRFAGRLERYRYQRDPSQLDAAGRLFAMERRLAALEAELEARLAVSDLAVLPIEQLQHRFGLSDLAIQFLIGAAAPGIDLVVGRTVAELNGDRAQCDVGFLCGVLTDNPTDQRILLGELGETLPLVRYRLIRIATPRGWLPEGPLLHAPVVVPDRIVRWLRGETHFEGRRFVRTRRHARQDVTSSIACLIGRQRACRSEHHAPL